MAKQSHSCHDDIRN